MLPGSTYTIGGRAQKIPRLPHKVWKTDQEPSLKRPVPILREQTLIDLRALAIGAFDVLRSQNIEFCVGFGTLLSAVVWGQFMSYDDDIDLCVDWAFREKLYTKEFQAALGAQGLERILLAGQGLSNSDATAAMVRIRAKGTYYPTLDIFFTKEHDDGRYGPVKSWCGDSVEFVTRWTYDDKSWMFPIQTREVDGMQWPLPNKPEDMLKRLYGDNALTVMESPQPLIMSHKFAFWISSTFGVWTREPQ
jgi:hypothetical protein